jgi:AcrR family transcriptional regulator
VHSIIGGGGATTILTPFRASGFEIREETPGRAVVLFRGRVPKQKAYSYTKGDIDPVRGFDCEVRLYLNSLSGTLHFEWRLTNQSGWKSWIERYALLLPVAPSFRVTANEAGVRQNLGSWAALEDGPARMAVTAPFVTDLGTGAGMRLENGFLLHGGIDMPIDGAITGKIPQVHRWFHYGMSRTFTGALLVGGTAEDARAEVQPLNLQLPAQYYSDAGVLPERGDKLTNGEFSKQLSRAANWLLENQWRGTLWWGEWWREYDLTREQGAEEASNGNSAVAPLYHYYRTGDGRFLECARRAAFYTYDVQLNRVRTGPGPFLHARRHLLDEQDWVHPRYQRLTGALIASHSLLATIEREELIAALRSYTGRLMDEQGRTLDWDKRGNKPGGPAGVDTSNIMEALVECWRESGDPSFLEKARRMSRWTMGQWRERKPGTWNWNLSQYVLRGLVAVGKATRDQQVINTSIDIARDVLAGQSEADLHFAFYNAWMAAELNRAFGADLPLDKYLDVTRRSLDRMGADGNFPVALPEAWAPYPSVRSSYYDSKAFVAYIPVLTAQLAAKKQKEKP